MPTWSTGLSLKGNPGSPGAPAPGLRSGPGSPSTTNPATQMDGDFYIRTDVMPNILFGPRAGGVWPAAGTAVSGGVIQSGQGAPSPSVGAPGDVYYDLLNAFFYPPKSMQGWVTPPIPITGPTGPSIQAQPMLGSFSASGGPGVQVNGVTATGTPQTMSASGTTLAGFYVPPAVSAFMGATLVNYSNSAGSLTFSLFDQTANKVVYSTSAAQGTVNSVGPFTTTQFPMTAGNTHVWRVTGTGAAFATISPLYLMATGLMVSVSGNPPFLLPSTTLSNSAQTLNAPGVAGVQYYRRPVGSYLYAVNVTVVGTGTASASLNGVFNTGPMTGTAQGANFSFGPFGVSTAYLAANTNFTWTVTGTGTAAVYITMQTVH